MRGGRMHPYVTGGGDVGVSSVTPSSPHVLPHHPYADSYCSSTKSVIVKREPGSRARAPSVDRRTNNAALCSGLPTCSLLGRSNWHAGSSRLPGVMNLPYFVSNHQSGFYSPPDFAFLRAFALKSPVRLLYGTMTSVSTL